LGGGANSAEARALGGKGGRWEGSGWFKNLPRGVFPEAKSGEFPHSPLKRVADAKERDRQHGRR